MAKLCAGQMSRLKCKQLGMEHIWTRLLSVYGPYDSDKTVVMSVVKTMISGKNPACTAGEQIWDFLYSKDAARALHLLGIHGVDGTIYCVGSGIGLPLRNYIIQIKDYIDSSLDIEFGKIPYAEKQVMYLVADISRLKWDTGFEAMYTFEEGIKDLIDVLMKNLEGSKDEGEYR